MAQELEYEITSWTPQEIVAIMNGGTGTIELHFNRTSKIVTMVESESTKIKNVKSLPAYAHLGSGTEAIEAYRK